MDIALDFLFAWFMFGLAAVISVDVCGEWTSPPPKYWRIMLLVLGPISEYNVLKVLYIQVRDDVRRKASQ